MEIIAHTGKEQKMPSMAIMIRDNPHHNYYDYRRSYIHNEKIWVTESL